MSEKSKRVDYEMKYIGWNIGSMRVERHETKGDIEILELKIDGVDVLKQLVEKAEKLRSVKSWYETRIEKYNEQIEEGQYVTPGILLNGLEGLGEILEAEG